MDLVQKEHDRLWKRAQGSKCIKDVQATINLLKEARDSIENGTSFAAAPVAAPLLVASPLFQLYLLLDEVANV